MSGTLVIYAVNLATQTALAESGEILEFDSMYDFEGDETENPDEAKTAILEGKDGRWYVIDLTLFEKTLPN